VRRRGFFFIRWGSNASLFYGGPPVRSRTNRLNVGFILYGRISGARHTAQASAFAHGSVMPAVTVCRAVPHLFVTTPLNGALPLASRKPGFPGFRFAPFVAPRRNERGPYNPLRCSIPPPRGAPNDLVHCVPCMHRRGRPGARTGAAKTAPHLLNAGAFLGARPCRISSINNLRLLLPGPSRTRLLHLLPVCTGAAVQARALARLKPRRICLTVGHLPALGRAALAQLTTYGCYCWAGAGLEGVAEWTAVRKGVMKNPAASGGVSSVVARLGGRERRTRTMERGGAARQRVSMRAGFLTY
jgi:hypothetical protein